MTDEEIVKKAKETEKRTGFGELVHSPISKGVNSAFGIGFIEGMVEYRDLLQEKPISEELEEAAVDYADACKYDGGEKLLCVGHFKAGAKWQKEHLWKPAEGSYLPILDREVIALLDNGKVVYAHRPPEYWDGKDIVTGKVARNYPKTYGKGEWNIPDVKWWLDLPLPYEELEENEESLCKPYEVIINDLYKTYKKKNADYGNSFADTIEEFGFIPAVARISDKVKRMKNIVNGQKMNVKDENFRDALMDTANYCIMTIMEIDKKK